MSGRIVATATAVAGAIVWFGFALAPALAQTAAPKPATDIVIARVEGQPIYRGAMLRAFASLPAQMKKPGLEAMYPDLIKRLIQQRLLVITGRKNNLAEHPVVIKRMEVLEDAVIGEVYYNQLIERSLTPGLLEKRYQEFLTKNPATDQVHARHILVKTEADAKNVIGHINAGKSFEDAAREFSTGPSASKGGDLGYFKKTDMVKPFAEAAFAMKAGDVTPAPVKTRFGWHVIKVENRRVTQPPSFEEMKPRILRDVGRNIAVGAMQKLVESAKVERFALDGTPMPQKMTPKAK